MNIFQAFNSNIPEINTDVFNDLEIDQIKSSEINTVIDFDIWLETIELQKEFNNKVAPGWMQDINQKQYNFWMAILDETVEVLNSKHWKWWKNSDNMHKVDWKNVNVELIDIFHFVMSICIQNNLQNTLFLQLVNMEMHKEELQKIKDEEFFDGFWEDFLMAVQMKLLPVVVVRLVEYWYRAGGDAESLFREYRIKASLNKIRQEFGYSQNAYEKIWLDVDTGTKAEDNVIAGKILTEVPIDKDTIDNMCGILRNYYLNNVTI